MFRYDPYFSGPYSAQLRLKQTTGPAKKHMVWVPGETGTLIGGGRWVIVDENGNPVDTAGASNVQKMGGSALQNIVPSHPAGH
jgi:hypothetical protein